MYVLAFSVSPTYKIQESCRLKALVSTLCFSFSRILKWDHFYLISHYSSQHNHPSLPSINVTLAMYHSLSAYFFFPNRMHSNEQKIRHVSCPFLHLLLGVQWQIPVLLCANVTALFTADLRVYIRPQCYLPVSLILSPGSPSYAVGVAAPVLKEFVSISAGTNPPRVKPLCSICSNWNFDKDILSTSTKRDCLFLNALGGRCVGSCLYLADNWDWASM